VKTYRIVQPMVTVVHTWPCICVLQRELMFGYYKAGLYGSKFGRMDGLTRLKELIARSIAVHELGGCQGHIYTGTWYRP
jgi:hypothetical protein